MGFAAQKAQALKDTYDTIFARDFPEFINNTKLFSKAYKIQETVPKVAKKGLFYGALGKLLGGF